MRRGLLLADGSVLVRLGAEGDLAGAGVHRFDDGQRFQLDAAGADQRPAGLEAFLNCDADALDGGAGALGKVEQAQQGAAVGQKVVDDQEVVLRAEELFRDDDVVDLLWVKDWICVS